MSDSQLDKLKQERDALQRELQLVQTAIPPSAASEKLCEYMAGKTDPFNQNDNEWISDANGPGGCCVIS
jgi:hypothetical protein